MAWIRRCGRTRTPVDVIAARSADAVAVGPSVSTGQHTAAVTAAEAAAKPAAKRGAAAAGSAGAAANPRSANGGGAEGARRRVAVFSVGAAAHADHAAVDCSAARGANTNIRQLLCSQWIPLLVLLRM